MKKILLAPAIALFSMVAGCIKDPADLAYNPLDDPSLELFTVNNVKFESMGAYRDLQVFYSTIYNQLTENQKNRIMVFVIFRNGFEKYHLTNLEGTWFKDPSHLVGTQVCYEFEFALTDGKRSRRSSKQCVTIE